MSSSCFYFFRVETCDGTAEAESDYKPVKQTLAFAPNETNKEVNVEIIDDDVWEPDEFFYVKLYVEEETERVVLGKIAINMVTIINDDGQLEIIFFTIFIFFLLDLWVFC